MYIYTYYIYTLYIYIYILYIHIYIYIDIGDTNANIERMCNDMNYIYLGSGEIRAPWDMKPWHSCSCHNTIATQRSLKRWKVHWHVSLPQQQPWHNPRIPGLLVTPNFLNFGQSTPDWNLTRSPHDWILQARCTLNWYLSTNWCLSTN